MNWFVEMVLGIVMFYGGLILALVCACVAVRKETELTKARLLLIAAVILTLAQFGFWEIALRNHNAI